MTLATLQVFGSHMWLVATILDSEDIGHSCRRRRFYWTMLVQTLSTHQYHLGAY